MEYSRLRPTSSSLSREITTLHFLRKFMMPNFNHYVGTSDPLHLLQYQDKMAVYPHEDLLY